MMSKKSILNYLMVVLFLFSANALQSASTINPDQNVQKSVFELNTDDLINLQKQELEDKINRKLTVKEKLALKFVRNKLKKNPSLTGEQALEEARTDGLAIAGFVVGLLSLLIFGLILGVLGVIFSAIALKRIRREPETRSGRGFAIAGLVLGIVGIVGWAVALLLIL